MIEANNSVLVACRFILMMTHNFAVSSTEHGPKGGDEINIIFLTDGVSSRGTSEKLKA